MTNTETMQLDLFHGVVLTTKQQEEVDKFVSDQAKRAVSTQESINRTMLLLDEAGFVQGVDYDSNFEVYEVTKEVSFGYSYNNTNWEHEVTYMNAVGTVYLIVDTIKEGKIVKYNASVDREGNKVMCTNITQQMNELNRQNKEQVCLDYTVAKYQKLYPEATVKAGSDYYRGYRRGYESFPIVQIEFKSGSSVTFKLGYGYEFDQERLHNRYDAQKETVEQTLERFNNQKSK